jgi:hypothetical protein
MCLPGEELTLSFVVLLVDIQRSKLEAAVEKASRQGLQYERHMKDLEVSREKTSLTSFDNCS